jgi:hypothetical protein
MEPAQPQELLGLLFVTVTSLVVLVYVFLRMAGVLGHRRRGPHRRGLH